MLFTTVQAAPALASDYYAFMVIGDYGFPTNNANPKLAGVMNNWARDTGASHVVAVGDNFYYRGVTSEQDPIWETQWYQPFKKLNSDLDRLPWHAMLGNHDYCNANPEAEFRYKNHNWRMDDFFWSYTVNLPSGKTAKFLYFDTDLITYGIDTADWIRKDCNGMYDLFQRWRNDPSKNWSVEGHLNRIENMLKDASQADWVFAFGHHPLGQGPCGGEGQTSRIASLLDKYKTSMWVNGHVHSLDYGVSQAGVPHFTSGAGGDISGRGCQPRAANQWNADRTAGFLVGKIYDGSMQVQVVDYNGSILFTTSLKPRK
ncbi:Metallo-dependent phosphatase-like protein [Gorgonomyces haynaldii]|nr:Metallo-dependent phosphatase-like protein [Gorgonomyces haynaldii]